MLIEGSSGSSGGLVGEHQPDELMRDDGRWVGRPLAVMSEMKVSQEDVRTRAWAWRGVATRTASRFMANRAPGLTESSAPRPVALATTSITGLFTREERAVREEGVGAGHRARAGELGYG